MIKKLVIVMAIILGGCARIERTQNRVIPGIHSGELERLPTKQRERIIQNIVYLTANDEPEPFWFRGAYYSEFGIRKVIDLGPNEFFVGGISCLGISILGIGAGATKTFGFNGGGEAYVWTGALAAAGIGLWMLATADNVVPQLKVYNASILSNSKPTNSNQPWVDPNPPPIK